MHQAPQCVCLFPSPPLANELFFPPPVSSTLKVSESSGAPCCCCGAPEASGAPCWCCCYTRKQQPPAVCAAQRSCGISAAHCCCCCCSCWWCCSRCLLCCLYTRRGPSSLPPPPFRAPNGSTGRCLCSRGAPTLRTLNSKGPHRQPSAAATAAAAATTAAGFRSQRVRSFCLRAPRWHSFGCSDSRCKAPPHNLSFPSGIGLLPRLCLCLRPSCLRSGPLCLFCLLSRPRS